MNGQIEWIKANIGKLKFSTIYDENYEPQNDAYFRNFNIEEQYAVIAQDYPDDNNMLVDTLHKNIGKIIEYRLYLKMIEEL